MTLHRSLPLLVAAILCVQLGCDRGQHPEMIGRVAPDFQVQDGTHSIRLSAYRGKVVVLNFWASWCAPCVAEVPSLEQLQHSMPQVAILAISTDDDATAYSDFLIEHHVDFETARDERQQSNALYGTRQFPETFIIDREGIIRRKFIGAQDFASPEVMAYLAKL